MKLRATIALLLILPAPLVGILCSLYMPDIGSVEIGKIIWLGSKVWMLLLPVCWLLIIEKGTLSWSKPSKRGMGMGVLLSLPVVVGIAATYWFVGEEWIDPKDVHDQVSKLGIDDPTIFLFFAIVMSLFNALAEEYVWRWFVFSKWKAIVGAWPAILLSAICFTVHHVVVMWNLGNIWLVMTASTGIFVGGTIWGWLYYRYKSVWPGWICHVAADAAIMVIAWQILKEYN